MEIEKRFAQELANSALVRADATGEQLGAAARAINGLGLQKACSRDGLDLMRAIDMNSTLLQGVGWVEGDEIRCSSFGGDRRFPMGKFDFRSSRSSVYRTNVTLLDPKTAYVAVQTGAAVGIIHKDLALSFVDKAPGLGVAVFSWSRRTPIINRGAVPPELIKTKFTGSTVFRSGGRTVAVVRSPRYDTGAIAILPPGEMSSRIGRAALVLLPLALLIGLGLSALLVHVLRSMGSLPAMIRAALKRGEFHLVYQPLIELTSGRTVGVEALLRWDRGKAVAIGPDEFIPAAEESGDISLITARVFDLVAEDARRIRRLAPDMHFAINVSAADLHRPEIVEDVIQLAQRSGMPFSSLTFEVTERRLVDVERARDTVQRLRAEGVQLAIDDFGIGYSSLAYLAQLEIDFVKIDKLFVQALGTESATSQVAVRIIEMAKDLNLEIIGEGVETQQQGEILKSLGVGYAQGYFFGRPMPLEALLQRLRSERVL
ncbi:EAL domain-containing protein [Phenylobacterium immobile]|uniref:EAL domain-containing protein n=1 Tax=Phenylobacterium immobile TaxID=21 RepID=UPI000AD5BFFC|nr:EAL domain-containing protein [Phenylobacterium immobile]